MKTTNNLLALVLFLVTVAGASASRGTKRQGEDHMNKLLGSFLLLAGQSTTERAA